MTNDTTEHDAVAVAPLPVGHDEPGSFWHVKPEHRADYVRQSTADMTQHERVSFRQKLANTLYADAVDVWADELVAEYVRRHGATEHQARNYLGDFSGDIRPDTTESMALHARFDVGGSEWPADAELRVEHLWRRGRAVELETARERAAAAAVENTCPMCQEHVEPGPSDYGTEPAFRVTKRTPVRGLPPVVVCGSCSDAIAHAHAERVADAVVAAGKSRRDLASEFLDAHERNGGPAPQIRTAADILAHARN